MVATFACLVVVGCSRPAPPSMRARPNVVLVVIDTLRADHLGAYGYARARTARLDAFAARGTRFGLARSTSSWTLPSTASILTGRYPVDHGAERMTLKLNEKQLMLAEMLAAAGYDTAGFSANAAVVTPESGFAQGFDRFDVLARRGDQSGADPVWPSNEQKPDATADVVTDAALEWVASRPTTNGPYFLYVHYFDPHSTYSPPPAYAEAFGVRSGDPLRGPAQALVMMKKALAEHELATLRALYDAEIAFTDREIGRLLDGIGFGRRHDIIVVITSDHGEEFGEHGRMQHTKTLYEEVLRVPLLVGGADLPTGRVVEAPVSLVGVFPTIAELAGVEVPSGLPGRSFVPVLRGAEPAPAPVFAELSWGRVHRAAVVDGSWKLLLDQGFVPTLYDLATDAGETTPRNQNQAARTGALQKAIGEHNKAGFRARAAAPPVALALDAERRERLRQLGYVVD
ncbi:MAG: sulfatase [Deltaproteobacteria bacterium]|nr:sulfatase [Deltaproteobacteria bacterium]